MPKDPIMLLSFVNTKLRDEYDSLKALCGVYGEDPEEIADKLSAVGYTYDAARNQFV